MLHRAACGMCFSVQPGAPSVFLAGGFARDTGFCTCGISWSLAQSFGFHFSQNHTYCFHFRTPTYPAHLVVLSRSRPRRKQPNVLAGITSRQTYPPRMTPPHTHLHTHTHTQCEQLQCGQSCREVMYDSKRHKEFE